MFWSTSKNLKALSVVGIAIMMSGCSKVSFQAQKDEALGRKIMGAGSGSVDGGIRQPGGGIDVGGGVRQPRGGGEIGGGVRQPRGGGETSGGVRQPGGGGETSGGVRQPGGGGETAGGVRQPGGGGETSGGVPQTTLQNGGHSIPITRLCSDSRSDDGMNLKRIMMTPEATAELRVNGQVCVSDKNAVRDLAMQNSLSIDRIKELCPSLLQAGRNKVDFLTDRRIWSSGNDLSILWSRNQDTVPVEEIADEHCTKRASPLVVHVGSDPSNPMPISLSSRIDGILFDLLGRSNNHQKVQISWFTNHDYRFLALPDRRGEVRGIDQLFGDNTTGPDGRGSDNGYAALAKYDGMSADGRRRIAKADGRIDRNDPIYGKLRLWLDKNFDGISQRDELVSLSRAGIEFIDLEYSSDYSEVDAHGNQTTMKSVVGLRDGSLDLIFDLWFAY